MNTAAHPDPLITTRQHQEGVPDRRSRDPRAGRRALSTSIAANTSRSRGRPAAASRRCWRSSACSIRRATASTCSTAARSPTSAPASARRSATSEIGFVFQAFNLIGDLTRVRERRAAADLSRRRLQGRAPRAHDRRARTRRHGASREALSGAAFGRPAAARRRRARAGRPAVDPARRRADRQPRLEERRSGHAAARRAAQGRLDDLHGHARSALRRFRRSARSSCSTAASSTRKRCIACATRRISA